MDDTVASAPPAPNPNPWAAVDQKFEWTVGFAGGVVKKHELDKPPAERSPLSKDNARRLLHEARDDLGRVLDELQGAWNLIHNMRAELDRAAQMLKAQQRESRSRPRPTSLRSWRSGGRAAYRAWGTSSP